MTSQDRCAYTLCQSHSGVGKKALHAHSCHLFFAFFQLTPVWTLDNLRAYTTNWFRHVFCVEPALSFGLTHLFQTNLLISVLKILQSSWPMRQVLVISHVIMRLNTRVTAIPITSSNMTCKEAQCLCFYYKWEVAGNHSLHPLPNF